MRRLIAISVFFLCASAYGATNIWYVDSDAAGNNKGTNWANAWNEMDQITWASVKPGDIIWVSGGTYTTDLRVAASGTFSSNIIVKASQEVGHNDDIIHNATVGTYAAGNYWTIDGSKADGITVTNTFHLKTVVPTNIAWFTRGTVCNSAGGGNYSTLRWLSVSNLSGVNDTWGINWSYGDKSNVIEYCWIHDVEDTGITVGQGHADPTFTDLTVRWNYMTNIGDDFYEGQRGATIHNNYFDRTVMRHGHPDGIAGHMGKMYIYNNVLVDVWDQILYLKIWEFNPDDHGDVYVYGNLIYMDLGASPPKADGVQTASSYGWETGRWAYGVPESNHWGNIVIANNTFIADGTTGAGKLLNMLDFVNAYAGSNIIYVTNMHVYNNIFYKSPSDGSSLKGAVDSGFQYTEANLRYDFNVIHSTVDAGSDITYLGTNYDDAEAFNSARAYKHNTSSAPTFASIATHDYRLAATDTVARNTGTNLASLGLPGLTTDLWGNTRGADGAWDRGAGETTTETNLLVWLTFQQSFDSCVLSNSATNWHALRWGRTNESCPSNFPTRIDADTIPGRTNIGSRYAGNFTVWDSDYSDYNREGQYAGITNGMERLSNMANATIMLWGKYHTSRTADWSTDGQCTFIDAGNLNNAGGWSLGRYNGPGPSMPSSHECRTVFVVVTNGGTRNIGVVFPDPGANGDGNTTNWHHYAILWSNGVAYGMFDGAYYTNSDIGQWGVTNLKVNYKWIGVGVRTHIGTPMMLDTGGDDDYPNHGWLNGAMDDVRIYDRLLTPTEVYNIYTNTGGIPTGQANPAVFTVTPSSRTISALTNTTPAETTYTIQNTGGTSQTISWTNIWDAQTWFIPSATNGTTTTETDTITITFTNNLAASTNVGYILNRGYTNGVIVSSNLFTVTLRITNGVEVVESTNTVKKLQLRGRQAMRGNVRIR